MPENFSSHIQLTPEEQAAAIKFCNFPDTVCAGSLYSKFNSPPKDLQGRELTARVSLARNLIQHGVVSRAYLFTIYGEYPGSRLTEAETTSLELIANGMTPLEVASALNVSQSSISRQTKAAREKLNAENLPQAILSAYPWALLKLLHYLEKNLKKIVISR